MIVRPIGSHQATLHERHFRRFVKYLSCATARSQPVEAAGRVAGHRPSPSLANPPIACVGQRDDRHGNRRRAGQTCRHREQRPARDARRGRGDVRPRRRPALRGVFHPGGLSEGNRPARLRLLRAAHRLGQPAVGEGLKRDGLTAHAAFRIPHGQRSLFLNSFWDGRWGQLVLNSHQLKTDGEIIMSAINDRIKLKFICPGCGNKFGKLPRWLKPGGAVTCPKCGNTFIDQAVLIAAETLSEHLKAK